MILKLLRLSIAHIKLSFCERNTLHAPYASPSLEYYKDEIYARLKMSEAYKAQLEVVAMHPGYDDWPWREVVELQRKKPSRLLNKYLSYRMRNIPNHMPP